jgi:glutathione S-transferase
MELILYTANMSRGFMVEWLLEELETPYTRKVIDLFSGYTQSEEYRAIHPLGSVPALIVDGIPHMESLAMMLFLADSFAEAQLAPTLSSKHRSAYLQWMVYCTATIEPALGPAFVRSLSRPKSERKNTATESETDKFHRTLEPLSQAMGNPSILPTGFSAVDVLLSAELYWADQVGLVASHPIASAYLKRMTSRPAFQRCQSRENSLPL